MVKNLPDDWVNGKKKSLNVAIDLGIKCPVTNLYVYRGPSKSQGKLLLCRWLPPEDEDLRPENKKRTSGGKRRYLEGRTGCEDPFDAGKQAVKWYEDVRKNMLVERQRLEYETGKSLHHYWELFYIGFQNEFINKRGGQKRITNTLSYWQGEEIGICHQDFSRKSIDRITYKDLADYWLLIDKRGKKKGSTMAETKKQIKAIINKLFLQAKLSGDFNASLRNPDYPVIHEGEKKSTTYLTRDEWDDLLREIIILSNGRADVLIDEIIFNQIEWTNRNRINPRNFVELYDALMVMWFFYLRAEDLPAIRTEWFSIRREEDGEEVAVLNLERAKGFKDLTESVAYRPDAVASIKRILKRRKAEGYLLYEFYNRPANNPSGSQVGETLNYLLQYAIKKSKIQKKIIFTSIRHTSFMETCKEFTDLRDETNLVTFARNAFTSAEMLREKYLKKIEGSRLASKARKTIKKGAFTADKSLTEQMKEIYRKVKAKGKLTRKEEKLLQKDIEEQKG